MRSIPPFGKYVLNIFGCLNLRDELKEKELLDKIRTRNGNLTVSCGLLPENHEEL